MTATAKNNRASRRKFAKPFANMAKGKTWGDWQDVDLQGDRGGAGGVPRGCQRMVYNDLYSVQFYLEEVPGYPLITRLLIRRNDGKAGVPWPHRQRIKDELAGPERQAVEVFPPADEVVDDANCYHLWVLPADQPVPFTLKR